MNYDKKIDYLLQNKNLISFNEPFSYFQINNFFDDDDLAGLDSEEILLQTKGNIATYNNEQELKIGISPSQLNNNKVINVLNYLNSKQFVKFLEDLTNISGLEGDDSFWGGGIHMIPTKGKLGIHVDFSRSPHDINKYRRCNVLLYLNKNWDESWGGALELWDKKPSNGGKCVKKIFPHYNTLVIFGTNQNSWHGHPTPLSCPTNICRKSLATYYYSKESGEDKEYHGTIFG